MMPNLCLAPNVMYSLSTQSNLCHSPQIFKSFILSLTYNKLPHTNLTKKRLRHQRYFVELSAFELINLLYLNIFFPFLLYYNENNDPLCLPIPPSCLYTVSPPNLQHHRTPLPLIFNFSNITITIFFLILSKTAMDIMVKSLDFIISAMQNH